MASDQRFLSRNELLALLSDELQLLADAARACAIDTPLSLLRGCPVVRRAACKQPGALYAAGCIQSVHYETRANGSGGCWRLVLAVSPGATIENPTWCSYISNVKRCLPDTPSTPDTSPLLSVLRTDEFAARLRAASAPELLFARYALSSIAFLTCLC